MVMLTEEMVIARTKQSNLSAITKLNCWGSQISDVTILRRMPNVTVLSLSVNSICSLADFQFCKNLQDLYVRKNEIRDLNQVCYLQDLRNLKSLWLDENPCASNDEGYRLAVLRALPQLTKLDDAEVDSTELEKAQRFGRVLVHPEQQQEYYEEIDEEYYEPPGYSQYQEGSEKRTTTPSEVSPQYVEPERQNYSPEPQYQRSREYMQNLSNYETEQEVYVEKQLDSPLDTETINRVTTITKDEPESVTVARVPYASIPRSRTADGDLNCTSDWRRQKLCQGNCTRRPTERRTNILNAVLCLIKELDYSNLEVVEMAVKCRMDELDS